MHTEEAPSKDPNATSSRAQSSHSAPVVLLVRDFDGGEPLWGWDLHEDGMVCRSRTLRAPGTFLNLDFSLPGVSDIVKVGAEVVRIQRDSQGQAIMEMEFCLMSGEAKHALVRFLEAG